MHCHIMSLKVSPEEKQKKYGTLLLSYALQCAKESSCIYTSLKSSEEAVGFYLNFGFRARHHHVESLDDWNEITPEIQDAMIDECDQELLLEFEESKVEELIEDNLEEAMMVK